VGGHPALGQDQGTGVSWSLWQKQDDYFDYYLAQNDQISYRITPLEEMAHAIGRDVVDLLNGPTRLAGNARLMVRDEQYRSRT
jgi:hypothetical protein